MDWRVEGTPATYCLSGRSDSPEEDNPEQIHLLNVAEIFSKARLFASAENRPDGFSLHSRGCRDPSAPSS